MGASSKQLALETIMLLIHFTQGRDFRVRVGIAVGNTGQCSEMEDAHRGHKLFADKLNGVPLFFEDSKGDKHRLLFDYTRYNDDCSREKHDELVRKLIFEDEVHFMLGSTPVFAESESIIADNAKRLIYHCCVGPDSLYEKDMKNVFGITVSNTRYPLKALKSMALQGDVKRLYIFALSENIFTSSTCESAVEYAEGILSKLSPNLTVIKMRRYTSGNASDESFYEQIVDDAINLQADALLGCDFKEPGIAVTQSLANRNYYVKALWLTVAPAHADFVPALGKETANHALSAGQWHPAMTFADEFFGTTAEYKRDFERAYNMTPSYVAAQASATSYSLAVAVRDAFRGCTLPDDPGLDMDQLLSNTSTVECGDEDGEVIVVNGYKHVKQTLAQQDLLTFFGEVVFNRFRRNIAKDPATFQILDGVLQAVLPLEFANKGMVMPWPEPEQDGQATIGVMHQDAFIALVVTVVGAVLLLCLAGILALLIYKPNTRRLDAHLLISVDDLHIIHPPVLLCDGSWESGKAIFKSALVALEPLTEAKLATKASATNMDPASTGEGGFHDEKSSSMAPSAMAPSIYRNSFDSVPERQAVALCTGHTSQASYKHDPEDAPDSLSHRGEHRVSIDGRRPIRARRGSTYDPSVSKGLDESMKEQDVETQPSALGSAVPILTKKQVLRMLWQYKCLLHPSIIPVMGVVWSLPSLPPNLPVLVTECEELGALASVQENETLVLDAVKKLDTAMDLASALAYLHAQEKPRLQPLLQPRLAGVQLNKHCRAKLRVPLTALGGPPSSTNADSKKMFRWPSCLSSQSKGESEPEEDLSHELEDVLRYGLEVAQVLLSGQTSASWLYTSKSMSERGSLLSLAVYEALQAQHGSEMAELLLECGSFNACNRPRFSEIHKRLDAMGHQAIHNAQLYHRIAPRDGAKQPADELLYELFPVKVAEALKAGKLPDPEPFPEISLFFCDICGFTHICSQLSPTEVMDMLHRLYTRFDALAQELQLFKVETVGDSYMCASNIKHLMPSTHAAHMADFAFRCCLAANAEPVCPSRPELGCIHIRAGIHSGAVMGAVVGTLNRRFCLFGDCVNVASRMESTCLPDHIQCSASFFQLLEDQWPEAAQAAVPQGPRLIKGKGSMTTFLLYPP